MTRQPSKQQRRRDRQEEERRKLERERAARRNRVIISVLIALLVVIVAGSIVLYEVSSRNSSSSSQLTATNPAYPVVDNNVACQAGENLAYHIHADLVMYINGQPVQLPANVGIASDQSCLYWLHTHDTSGIIHIESPAGRNYSLGNFLDEWSQVFSNLGYPSQLDLTSGWTVWVNGKTYTGNFHNIPLQAHEIITLAYNSPGVKPTTTYNWNGL